MRTLISVALLSGLLCLFHSQTSYAETKVVKKNLIQIAKQAGNLTIFLKAVQVAGLTKALQGKGSLTVFAPSNKAFQALPPKLLSAVLKNPAKLATILKYHVLAAKVMSGDVLKINKARTLQGGSLGIGLSVNGKRVIRANLLASNGVIHIIDGVMLPKPKRLTRRDKALALIRLAISRGVPLFNRGQRAACSAIYEVAVQSLLDGYSRLFNKATQKNMRETLDRIKGMRSSYAQAWALRYALDKAKVQLQRTKKASR